MSSGLLTGSWGGGAGATAPSRARVYSASGGTLAAAAQTKVPYDTVSFDPDGLWDAGNARFDLTAGLWLFNFRLRAAAARRLIGRLYVDGSAIAWIGDDPLGETQYTSHAACHINMAAAGYAELQVHNGGMSTTVSTGDAETYWDILGPF